MRVRARLISAPFSISAGIKKPSPHGWGEGAYFPLFEFRASRLTFQASPGLELKVPLLNQNRLFSVNMNSAASPAAPKIPRDEDQPEHFFLFSETCKWEKY